jgi:hypothetical protein
MVEPRARPYTRMVSRRRRLSTVVGALVCVLAAGCAGGSHQEQPPPRQVMALPLAGHAPSRSVLTVARREGELAGWQDVRVTRHARIVTIRAIAAKDTWQRGFEIVQTALPANVSQRYLLRDSSGQPRAVVSTWQADGSSGANQWLSPAWFPARVTANPSLVARLGMG